MSADRELGLRMLSLMILSRTLEDRLHILHKQGRLRGRLISGRGQEAIPVGSTLALKSHDIVCPVHRDLGAHLVRGTTPETVLLHYYGKAAGPSRGRDGDIHMGEWSRNVFPMVSHLPDSWPIAVGMGMAAQRTGDRSVILAFCGDGATSTGTWHEALNFASVFKAPTVFVVENNGYAYSTPTSSQFRVRSLSERGAAYAIPGKRVDGNDCREVYATVAEAVDRARNGEGPSLIEAVTMRLDGHAVHDEASYVPESLLREWRVRDPIRLLSEDLRKNSVEEAEIEILWERAKGAVNTAVKQAENAPDPDPSLLAEGLHA